MDSERGYTFVEVLVVMVVLSIAVLGALQTTLLAARLERRSDAIASGTFLAQERLERIGALGWERATAGLAVAPLPEALGAGAGQLQEEVARPGLRFLLVFEREPAPADPPSCSVRCYWAGVDGAFSPRDVVRLALRRPR